jgi:hypothetical protein
VDDLRGVCGWVRQDYLGLRTRCSSIVRHEFQIAPDPKLPDLEIGQRPQFARLLVLKLYAVVEAAQDGGDTIWQTDSLALP